MISCEHLHKEFKEKTAINDLTFSIKENELFALLGGNGAGKSTTIKIILNLLTKTSGTVSIKEGSTIGYSPETPYFLPFLTGVEVLEYYCGIQKIKGAKQKQEIRRVMELTELETSKIKVKHYSKGMIQRLAVAQALLGDPEILILDEPTAGLDALGRCEMIRLLKQLKQSGKTILLNSHILNDVEKICDRAIIMKKGQVVSEWNAQETHTQSLEEIFIDVMEGVA